MTARGTTAWLLLALGTLLAARPAAHAVRRGWSACRARRDWQAACARPEADAPGLPAAWLRIPACGVDTLVLRGDAPDTLRRAPGLLTLPGGVMISAHRDQHFRRLARLRQGHGIELQAPGGQRRRYRVTEIECLPRDAAARRIAQPRGTDWLLLVTCHPFRLAGPAPNRLLAWARPEDAPDGP